jgi:hypothetical protein
VARRAELAVRTGLGELAEQVFIHVALEVVALVGREVHVRDDLDDGAQRGTVVDLECRVSEQHLARLRQARQLVQLLDRAAQGVEQLVAGERDEVVPRVARPLAGEDAPVALLDMGRLLVALKEQPQKD